MLCLHSLGQSKMEFLLPKPIPGIFLISVDRQGHGSSSPYPPASPVSNPRKFSDDMHEYVELLDSLSVDKFYVTRLVNGRLVGRCDRRGVARPRSRAHRSLPWLTRATVIRRSKALFVATAAR